MSIVYPSHVLPRPAVGGTVAQQTVAQDFVCHGLSVRRILLVAVASLVCILVNKAGMPGNLVFFLFCAFLLTRRPAIAVAGAMLPMLGLAANTAFVPKTIAWTFGRLLNLFAFSGRFTLGGAGAQWLAYPPYVALSLFCGIAASCSLVSGYYVHIALLKLLNFWVGMTGVFACVHTIRRTRTDTTEWYVAQAATVCLMCILALLMGVGSNFRGGVGALGLYNLAFYHSQSMGPGAALLITYLLCVYLLAGHRNRWICLIMAAMLVYFLGMTRSRTGVVTLLAGVGTLVGCVFVWRRKGRMRLRINTSRLRLVAYLAVGVVAIILADVATRGGVTRRVYGVIAKRAGPVESVTIEEAMASRRHVMDTSYANFLESPLYGIGFQVSTSQYFIEHATLFTAPVEKGFLPTALLEEVGVLGTSGFAVFLIVMYASLIRDRNIPGVALFTAFLVSNLGEVAIFAFAGTGAYSWMLVAGGIMLGDRCTRAATGPRR